jgi:hypothetical protein
VIRRYLASEKTVEEIAIREDLRGALEHFLIEVNQIYIKIEKLLESNRFNSKQVVNTNKQ